MKAKTIDVHGFWPEVTVAVRSGDMMEAKPSALNKGYYQGRKKHSSGHWETRHARGKARAGAFIRDFTERQNFYDDEDSLIFQWTPRGKLLTNARYMTDWEFFDDRSRHSTGWKEHKCKHQWEQKVRNKEKHQKNRDRNALRRKEYAGGKDMILKTV